MFHRVFWSFNASVAGILIGLSVFNLFNTPENNIFSIIILFIGISHSFVSILGFRKFVGKGFLFNKD